MAMHDAFLQSDAVNLDKDGTREIIATPGALKELWIHGFHGVCLAIGTVQFRDSTPTARTGVYVVAANQIISLGLSEDSELPWIKCSPNTAFQAVLSVDTDLDGIVVYQIRDSFPPA